jgi:hypothetical protein
MVAVYVVKDESVLQMVSDFLAAAKPPVELLKATPGSLDRAYTASRALGDRYKLVVTVLEGSSLRREVGLLKRLPGAVELCTSRYSAVIDGVSGRREDRGRVGA